jgi:hypothetical protein
MGNRIFRTLPSRRNTGVDIGTAVSIAPSGKGRGLKSKTHGYGRGMGKKAGKVNLARAAQKKLRVF